MALTKVTKTGISDNSIDADKIEDGTIVAADIAPGTITNAKLAGSIANDKLANSSITVNGSSVSLGGSVSAGKVSWQSVKTADFNAVAGEGYFVDTNSVGTVTATLPGSPSAGDTIAFKDYAANFGTNSLTIARNGNNIQGVANNSEISTNRASIVLVYIDATKGWLFTNESNVANLENAAFITATGGTITTSGDYKIHTFTGDGCFVVSCAGGVGPGPSVVDYLVVAGGGGGGGGENVNVTNSATGAGAGAGGYRESSGAASGCFSISPLGSGVCGITVSATTYPVSVGGGGAAGNGGTAGTTGSNSVFSTITSAGGGYAGRGNTTGGNGGSGGGVGGACATGTAGTGNTPPVSPPQGNPGANNPNNSGPYGGSGGGGATAAGSAGSGGNAGNGGAGATSSINGTPTGRAGGGGGGAGFAGSVSSPVDGGGYGGYTPQSNGVANTGGGGGGTNADALIGGTGGKGIVIIRYKFQ